MLYIWKLVELGSDLILFLNGELVFENWNSRYVLLLTSLLYV